MRCVCLRNTEIQVNYWLLMSFSALNGFALKLSRHFLKICRWILLKMSLNCKLLGMNGSFSSSFRLKKARESLPGPNCWWRWQRKLLFLWLIFFGIGIFWLVISLNGGIYSWKQEASEPNEDKSYFLLERFNVSKEQIQDLATLFFEKDQVSCNYFDAFGVHFFWRLNSCCYVCILFCYK